MQKGEEEKEPYVTLLYLLDIGTSYIPADKGLAELKRTIESLENGVSAIKPMASCEISQNNEELYIRIHSEDNLSNVLRQVIDTVGFPIRIDTHEEHRGDVEALLNKKYNKTLSFKKSREYRNLLSTGLRGWIEAKFATKKDDNILRDLGYSI